MAKILAYQTPAMGHFFPISVLLTELRNRGHDIALRTLADGVEAGLSMGFDTAPVDPRIEAMPLDDGGASNPQEALLRVGDLFARRAEYEVPDLTKAIDDARPDVLIVDPNCWGAYAVAEASGLPWASFWAFLPYLRSQGVPPWGPGLRPWPGPVGRLRDALLRRKFTAIDSWVGPLNIIRARLGVSPLTSIDDYARRPPLVLVATAQPFDYPHPDWDDSIQFIGACSYDSAPSTAPEWLAQIDRPIVLASTSSEDQGDGELARVALAALADQPVHVVATFPAGVPADIAAPANATVCEFVPHSLVLDRAVCAITHGGMGVTQKALARGVPACVVPYGRDQFEVARRVEMAKCGTWLLPKNLTAARLRDKVIQAMAMTEGARRVAAGYVATGGAAHGADLIEQRLLASPQLRSRPA
ncbi:nucleotide disphospho-sugar-binding domain-containing protein [Mycolicibacterium stellerae]|uniref:nucleotide disphospho-sugar-binding domain-containing protein n=1 Tax=Mycolicibacterium stellerae TaxID=2358193 RepID=UPI000F0B4D6E|nr:nucleotide disphospho-sugar-binding domain-containing protein [Mycolicibacterium stellerae]